MAQFDPAARLEQLFGCFTDQLAVGIPSHEVIPAEQVPDPYHELLVHDQHMTVTLERFHKAAVELHVLARHHRGSEYARMIVLGLKGRDGIVEFGIVRMDLSCCSEAVQREIVSGVTPLGRILIEHDVLRHIEPKAYLRITPTRAMADAMRMDRVVPLYGRLAEIICNGIPAVELLEVVRAEREPPGSCTGASGSQ